MSLIANIIDSFLTGVLFVGFLLAFSFSVFVVTVVIMDMIETSRKGK